MKDIDKSTRIANYLIDILVISLLWIIYSLLFQPYSSDGMMFYVLMFFYYLIFEATTGQTLGKMFTKTRVVQKDGCNPNFQKILMRSFLRIIPIDALSYMCGSELGLHDKLSFTKLAKKTS